jgi:16S rRNA (guanine966-N2)-methyltransferase
LSTNSGGPFDLAFLDPPYRCNLLALALESLRGGGWLAPGGLVVAEHAIEEPPPQSPNFSTLDCRSYGDTAVGFLRLESGNRS